MKKTAVLDPGDTLPRGMTLHEAFIEVARIYGSRGGKKAIENTTPEQRKATARRAALARWSKRGRIVIDPELMAALDPEVVAALQKAGSIGGAARLLNMGNASLIWRIKRIGKGSITYER